MIIDLQKLNYEEVININDDLIYNSDYYKDTDIISLENVHVSGVIENAHEGSYCINLIVTGQIMLNDAITLEAIPYDFKINIEEILENSSKSLDLNEFLWHYIVLEVPLRYTRCDNLESLASDKYKIISEDEYENNNNPFKDFFKE